MDQKRLVLAIAISLGILLISQMLLPHRPPQHPASETKTAALSQAAGGGSAAAPGVETPPGTSPPAAKEPQTAAPRLPIDGARVKGSINLAGARIDELVLRDYRETTDPNSPQVDLLEPRGTPHGYFLQYGWTAAPGQSVKVPDIDTVFTASGGTLTASSPVTLTWDNGGGQSFQITLSIDGDYMLTVKQTVRNTGASPVSVFPWARIRRDYTPQVAGYYLLHEGLLGVLGGTLHEQKYSEVKSEGDKNNGVAFESTGTGGWAGITDKYWLTALVPDAGAEAKTSFRHVVEDGRDEYQVDTRLTAPETIAPGAEASSESRAFAGAKEVRLLQRYEDDGHIRLFSYAVDFGWFWFLTKPIFYALDWLNAALGNFGLAILAFTLLVKLLFFPLASKSYRSMSKMKLLGPKVAAVRERYKDDPAKLQQEMMAVYKTEKVNPASGCLPMLLQIPVFFSLYKVIFVTIEMRQAPFYGWVHDLSATDPTNVFNLFGLLPFDPTVITPLLHLSAWTLIMGATMFAQQQLNPPPPDPVQAKLFKFMPLMFMFMLAKFPAGLVIYWSWNNTLTVIQQWYIMRHTRLSKAGARG